MSITDKLRRDLERDIEEWKKEDSPLKPVGESIAFGILGIGLTWRILMHGIVAAESDSWSRPEIAILGSPFDLSFRDELVARSFSMLSAGFFFAAQYPRLSGFVDHPILGLIGVANLAILYLDPFYMIVSRTNQR